MSEIIILKMKKFLTYMKRKRFKSKAERNPTRDSTIPEDNQKQVKQITLFFIYKQLDSVRALKVA